MCAEIGPGGLYASGRIYRNAGIVADKAAGELDVRIGRLRGDAGPAGLSVRRTAVSVVEAHWRQIHVHRRGVGKTRIPGGQEPPSTGTLALALAPPLTHPSKS